MDTRTHPSLNTDEAHVTTSHERKCVTYEQPHTEQQFFSIAFQRYEALTFYSQLLKKVITFAKTLDEGTPAIRESIWQQLYSLLGTPDQQADGRHFLPLLSEWLREPTINLFGLELLYIVFMLTTSGHSHLNLATSSQTTTTKEFSPWGSTIPCALYQLSLLQHWDNKLEKLSAAHRKAVWNACRMVMPNITELDPSCDQTSFRKTFANWSREPLSHLTSITVMFAAIGFLKECGLLKSEFCYPKTTVAVFSSYPAVHIIDSCNNNNSDNRFTFDSSNSSSNNNNNDDNDDVDNSDDDSNNNSNNFDCSGSSPSSQTSPLSPFVLPQRHRAHPPDPPLQTSDHSASLSSSPSLAPTLASSSLLLSPSSASLSPAPLAPFPTLPSSLKPELFLPPGCPYSLEVYVHSVIMQSRMQEKQQSRQQQQQQLQQQQQKQQKESDTKTLRKHQEERQQQLQQQQEDKTLQEPRQLQQQQQLQQEQEQQLQQQLLLRQQLLLHQHQQSLQQQQQQQQHNRNVWHMYEQQLRQQQQQQLQQQSSQPHSTVASTTISTILSPPAAPPSFFHQHSLRPVAPKVEELGTRDLPLDQLPYLQHQHVHSVQQQSAMQHAQALMQHYQHQLQHLQQPQLQQQPHLPDPESTNVLPKWHSSAGSLSPQTKRHKLWQPDAHDTTIPRTPTQQLSPASSASPSSPSSSPSASPSSSAVPLSHKPMNPVYPLDLTSSFLPSSLRSLASLSTFASPALRTRTEETENKMRGVVSKYQQHLQQQQQDKQQYQQQRQQQQQQQPPPPPPAPPQQQTNSVMRIQNLLS